MLSIINRFKEANKRNYKPYYKRKFIFNFFEYIMYFCIDNYLLIKQSYNLITDLNKLQELKKTSTLRNTMNRTNVFVFANGPSLKKLDFFKVKKYQEEGFKIFCVNSFIGDGTDLIFIPDYYVLSDPAFFGFYNELYENLGKEADKRIKEIKNNVNALKNNKDIKLFVPIQFYRMLDMNNEIFYFNDIEYIWFNKNVSNIIYPRSYISMTAYKALAIACFMGFKKIYICGFDNDYFKNITVDIENNLYYANMHFREQEDSKIRKVVHNEASNIAELLLVFSSLFEDLYKFPKDRIINLDNESLVDAFSKKHDLDVYI
jgi:hypothetical protein